MVAPVIGALIQGAVRAAGFKAIRSIGGGGVSAPDLSSLSNVGGTLAGGVTADFSKLNALFSEMALTQEKADGVMEEFCETVTDSARLRAPVDTGKLKRSIRYVREREGQYTISADAPHAAYVEYGTRKMRPQPFMGPAVAAHQQRLINRLKSIARGQK